MALSFTDITGFISCYIGETKRHLNTRIEEHLEKDTKPHIYSHLCENPRCQEKVNFDCFEIIDRAFSYFKTYLSNKCISLTKTMKKTNKKNKKNENHKNGTTNHSNEDIKLQ